MPVAWTFQWIDVPSEAIAESAAHKVNVGVGFGEVRSNGAWIGRAAEAEETQFMARTALNGVVQYLIGEIRESRNSRIIRVNQVLTVNSLVRLSQKAGTRVPDEIG